MRKNNVLILSSLFLMAMAGPAYGLSGFLKQSTAVTIKVGPMYTATDGVTPENDLTLHAAHIELSKNGAAFAGKSSATNQVYDKDGFYDIATDTGTLGILTVKWYDPNAVCVPQEYMVLTANVYDTMFSTATLAANVTQWSNTAVATPDTAGYPKVTLKTGTGAGELAITSGRANADVIQWNGATTGIANWTNVFGTAFATAFDDTNDVWNSRMRYVSKSAGLGTIAEVQAECEQAIDAKRDAIADKVWLNDPNSTKLTALSGVVVTKLDTALEVDGGVYRLTANSLEQAPAPTGATDWTTGEKEQIRQSLGIDGTKATATGGHLQTIKTATDKVNAMVEADGGSYRFTTNAVEQAPSSTGGGWTPLRKSTAQGGTATTITLDTGASATSSIYKGNRVIIYAGTGAGQSNIISGYNGSTKVAECLSAWIVAPAADSQYEIQAADGELLRKLQSLWN